MEVLLPFKPTTVVNGAKMRKQYCMIERTKRNPNYEKEVNCYDAMRSTSERQMERERLTERERERERGRLLFYQSQIVDFPLSALDFMNKKKN